MQLPESYYFFLSLHWKETCACVFIWLCIRFYSLRSEAFTDRFTKNEREAKDFIGFHCNCAVHDPEYYNTFLFEKKLECI